MDSEREGEGGKIWENGIEICIKPALLIPVTASCKTSIDTHHKRLKVPFLFLKPREDPSVMLFG